jgi:hypothetical protein
MHRRNTLNDRTDVPHELRRRPWLRVKPRPLRQTVVIDRQPNVQISVFDDAVYLTRRRVYLSSEKLTTRSANC